MGTQRSPQRTAGPAGAPAAKKSTTPPKGRPTRARDGRGRRKRVFGPVAQWVTVALAVALVVIVLVVITDGGDFNPFDEEELPSQFGAPAASALVA